MYSIHEKPDNPQAILEYLQEFRSLASSIMTNESELIALLDQSIQLWKNGSEAYRYQQLYQRESKKRASFNYTSIIYLLERRKLVLYGGVIHIVTSTSVVPCYSSSAKNLLKLDYGLSSVEVTGLLTELSQLDGLAQYIDKRTGQLRKSKFPKTYNPNLVGFDDILIDMRFLKKLPYEQTSIPAFRLHADYTDYDQKEVADIKKLLMFIADYNHDNYHRLCQMLAFPYTRPTPELMFVLLGKGGNGKGVFLQLIERLCQYNSHKMASMAKFMRSSSVSRESEMLDILTSKATLVGEETEFSKTVFDSVYKNLIDGGTETGRKLQNDTVSMENKSVIYSATNEFDFEGLSSTNNAFDRRMRFTDFTNSFISDADKALVKVLGDKTDESNYGVVHFLNLLHLLMDELEHCSDLHIIPQVSSQFITNQAISESKTELYEFLSDLKVFENILVTRGNIPISAIEQVLHKWNEVEVNQFINNNEELDLIYYDDEACIVFSERLLTRKILQSAKPEDFIFHTSVNQTKLMNLCKQPIRITEVFYKLGLVESKEDLIDYAKSCSFLEITEKVGQPFVQYIGEIPTVNPKDLTGLDLLDYLENLTGMELLDFLTSETKPDVPTTANQFSVFDCGRYPIAEVDNVTYYTDDLTTVLSPVDVSKEASVKMFPYTLETRGGAIAPSNWLALDFDECSNPTELEPVLQELTNTGLSFKVQESISSRATCSKCHRNHTKWHLLVECSDAVTATNYNQVVSLFKPLVSYTPDKNYRYNSIINNSWHEWLDHKGTPLDITNLPAPKVQAPVVATSNLSRDCEGDWSNFTSIVDYIAYANHDTARLLLKVMQVGFTMGSRDNTIYDIMMFLNDAYTTHNMLPSVYMEGVEALRSKLQEHNVYEGKSDLMRKINRMELEVTEVHHENN